MQYAAWMHRLGHALVGPLMPSVTACCFAHKRALFITMPGMNAGYGMPVVIYTGMPVAVY